MLFGRFVLGADVFVIQLVLVHLVVVAVTVCTFVVFELVLKAINVSHFLVKVLFLMRNDFCHHLMLTIVVFVVLTHFYKFK